MRRKLWSFQYPSFRLHCLVMFDCPSHVAFESHKSEEYTELPEEGSPGSEVRSSEQM